MPAEVDLTLPLPGLSPVCGKPVDARFDGGRLSSDGGIFVLREVEQRLRVADRMAACIKDPRSPDQITHSLADIIRFPRGDDRSRRGTAGRGERLRRALCADWGWHLPAGGSKGKWVWGSVALAGRG